MSATIPEHKKESPPCWALKQLVEQEKKLRERQSQLEQTPDSLRTGYDFNYQYMAVLEAVRGWEGLADLPHINDVGKDSATASKVVTKYATPASTDGESKE
ncbi:hypothetical protein MPER_06595 [Moniliophthora perniciosa FA553]|nr:hypothetical protein MPER_06595 [Moniliophthora perniciosa FA553]